ncbi:hypothetical protein [Micromonospora sp. CA-248212]|uniref:hypothetical protein n=1 Tax=Micromonospora sp. CA-248212 TaxID=3239961 RepID=UPI003D90EB51
MFWSGRDGLLVALRFDGIPDSSTTIGLTSAVEGDPTGLVRRLENQLTDLDATRTTVQARIAGQHEEIARATEQLDQPFPGRDELLDTRRRLRAINAVIDLMADTTPPSSGPPAVPVNVDHWMPTDLRDSLTPDEQTWLDRRMQHVPSGGAVQDAARTNDLADFTAPFDKALTHALADPGNTELAVAVMLKCDEPAWRQALYSAAGQAVHQAVRDTPPPGSAAGPSTQRDSRPDQSEVIRPLASAAIVAATTPADRALLDACTQQALRVDAVQAAARAGDQTAFSATFAAAMTTAIAQLGDSADVVRLADLHADQAFRRGLANLVRDKLTPTPAAEHQAAPSATVDAASVAAKAFLPAPRAASTGASAAASISPAPTTAHRAAGHDHAR